MSGNRGKSPRGSRRGNPAVRGAQPTTDAMQRLRGQRVVVEAPASVRPQPTVTEILRSGGEKPGFLKGADEKFRERQEARAAREADEPTEDQVRAMAKQIAAARAVQQSWRPACTMCVNVNKLALAGLSAKMAEDGIKEGSPEWMDRANLATIEGQKAYQEGRELPEGALPPVRPADIMVAGTGLCMYCFQPTRPPSQEEMQQAIQPKQEPGRSASGLFIS